MRAHIITTTACAALALGAAAAAMPAAAQVTYDPYTGTYVDEVVVPGRYYRGDRPTTLSRAVSYRDLDLTTYSGQRTLKLRIQATARDLCRELGEGRGNGGPLVRSCEDDAVRSARNQTRYAIARAQARSYYASLY
jgi:UrcA family protein